MLCFDVPFDDDPALNAVGTTLGAYMEQLRKGQDGKYKNRRTAWFCDDLELILDSVVQ